MSPSAGEKYFLRVLLTHVAGAMSFEDPRMYNGITYERTQEACHQRGLLDDDQQWDNCLTEAAIYQSTATLRQLFITILEFNQPEDPWGLWAQHKDDLLDDIVHELHRSHTINTMPPAEEIGNMGLLRVEELLQAQGKSLRNFPSMHMLATSHQHCATKLRQVELNYDREQLQIKSEADELCVTAEQSLSYVAICEALEFDAQWITKTPTAYWICFSKIY